MNHFYLIGFCQRQLQQDFRFLRVQEAAGDKADSTLAELRRKADEDAMGKAAILSKQTEIKKTALRARAEARLDRAASLVVERIVKN